MIIGQTISLGEDLEESIPADQIKSPCEVCEAYGEWQSLFSAFLLQLSEGKDHVDGGSVRNPHCDSG